MPDIANVTTNIAINAEINKVKNEIPSITNLATTTALNSQINEAKSKILNISKLATTTALTAVNNTDYNTKTNAIENKMTTYHDHDKRFTTQEFNKLTSENLSA